MCHCCSAICRPAHGIVLSLQFPARGAAGAIAAAARSPCDRRYLIGVQAVTFIFYHSILQVDEEEFGGHLELMGEDQNITVPTFLVRAFPCCDL